MSGLHPIFAQVLDSHLAVTKAVTPKDTYRGWSIHQGRWPEPAWSAIGPNYDASYEGEEDGWVGNGECAYAATREALITEIDEWFEENACTACDGEGRVWNNSDPTSGQFHECECVADRAKGGAE